MQKIKVLMKYLPRVLEYLPAILTILSMIKAKWYVKAILLLVFGIVCVYFLQLFSDPFVLDPDHPLDTIGRVSDGLIERAAGMLDALK